MSKQTQIYIVEDNAMLRHLLRQIIERRQDLVVCGEAATGEDALAEVDSIAIDLLLVDVSLPKMSGIELVKHVQAQQLNTPCLMLSGHQEPAYVQQALNAGAMGYLSKDKPQEFYAAIEQVVAGQLYLSPSLRQSIEGYQEQAARA